jgi:hypothetical protein
MSTFHTPAILESALGPGKLPAGLKAIPVCPREGEIYQPTVVWSLEEPRIGFLVYAGFPDIETGFSIKLADRCDRHKIVCFNHCATCEVVRAAAFEARDPQACIGRVYAALEEAKCPIEALVARYPRRCGGHWSGMHLIPEPHDIHVVEAERLDEYLAEWRPTWRPPPTSRLRLYAEDLVLWPR